MSLILTKAGLAALVQAESTGTKIQATHMAVGDGGGATPEHTSASTGLVHENWRGALQSIAINEQGETEAGEQVVFEVHIPITVGGWYIRECAIYANDTLLAIGAHPVLYKPDPEDATKAEHIIKALITFSNAALVNLTVDPNVVLASQSHVAEKVAEHDADEAAHQELMAAMAGGLTAHASRTNNPHAVTAEQVGAAPADHTHDNAAPTGTIRAIDSETVPTGYLELDGSLITVAEDADLVAVVGTKHVPDWSNGETVAVGVLRAALADGAVYISTSSGTTSGTDVGDDTGVTWTASTSVYLGDWRGRFPRGWDHGLGLDPGRALGSTQDDALQGHGHALRAEGGASINYALVRGAGASNAFVSGQTDRVHAYEAEEHLHGVPREAVETRPLNISTMWIIKR
ncbi:MAG: phage tail protein [Proteobacteria bacterium]|nr:phage tail protein [Pseudomonadota bacterium]